MDHIKKVITWAKANKQKSIAIVVAVVFLIAIFQQFMIDGLSKCEHSCDLFTDQERVSL